MTPNEINYYQQQLVRRGATLPCPACGGTSFGILPELFSMPILVDNSMRLNQGVPAVSRFCGNCGHITLFSAGRLRE